MKLENAFLLILSFHFSLNSECNFELNSGIRFEPIPILSFSDVQENCEGFEKLTTSPDPIYSLFPNRIGKLVDVFKLEEGKEKELAWNSYYISFLSYILSAVLIFLSILTFMIIMISCCLNYSTSFKNCIQTNDQNINSCPAFFGKISFVIFACGIISCIFFAILYLSRIKTEFNMVKCSISISYYEFLNGQSSFSNFASNWTGINNLVSDLMVNSELFYNTLRKSLIYADIKSGKYKNDCISITEFQNDLNVLFGPASSPASVIQFPARKTEFSLIPAEASTASGSYEIEFDHGSIDFVSKIKEAILNEYLSVSQAIPSMLDLISQFKSSASLSTLGKHISEYQTGIENLQNLKKEFFKKSEIWDQIFLYCSLIFIFILQVNLVFILIIFLGFLLTICGKADCFIEIITKKFCIPLYVIIFCDILLMGCLMVMAIFIHDTCDLISLKNISNNELIQNVNFIPMFDVFLNECLNGEGKLANKKNMNSLKNELINLDFQIQKLESKFAQNNEGLLPILDMSIGTRIDHCCIFQPDESARECTGLFPYSSYIDNNSLIINITNSTRNCPGLTKALFSFYHPISQKGLYDDCPIDNYVNPFILTSQFQCVLINNVTNLDFFLRSTSYTLCRYIYNDMIDFVFPKLLLFAKNVRNQDSAMCDKFYGSNNPYKGYDDASPNNLFAAFKLKHYSANTKCDPKILKDIQIFINEIKDTHNVIINYLNNGLDCKWLKDIFYRINFSVCSNLGSDINKILLLMILAISFDILVIPLLFFLRQIYLTKQKQD